jgi:diguanylate cyclase (GGDEF)-like protein
VIADLDGFKQINDVHGHSAGDAVLRHFGQNLRTHTRSDDFVARFGGDEFAILMTGSKTSAAEKRIAQLQKATARFPLIWQGKALSIKASFGYAAYGAKCDIADIIHAADEAMYGKKHSRQKANGGCNSDHNAA